MRYRELNIVVGVIILDQDHDPSMFICAIAIKRGYGLREHRVPPQPLYSVAVLG